MSTSRLSRLLVIALGLLLPAAIAAADGLLQAESRYFTIIYPPSANVSAAWLQENADALYDDLATRLGVTQRHRIPVYIDAGTELLNGSFTTLPSPRIELYQAPISPNTGFAIFGDNLKKLFLHELVHAISLTSADPWVEFLAGLFGAWVYPGIFTAPPAFVEGVTVSMESDDGFGRARDTPYASIIQQAIIENRFPDFLEANGARGGYPGGSWYIYGGFFSRYLRETHGDEAYARFWTLMGRARDYQDGLLGAGAFREAFGTGLEQSWEAFRQWMAIRGPVHTATVPVGPENERIAAVTGHGNTVYWQGVRGIWQYREGKQHFLAPRAEAANRLAVSADGKQLLVSATRPLADGKAMFRLQLIDTATGQLLPDSYPPHLSEAAFSPGGLVACKARGYFLDLVRIVDGQEQILIHGSARLAPSMPTWLPSGEIVFLLQLDGRHYPAWLSADGQRVRIARTGLEGIRYFHADGERLLFAWDNDRSLFKLGELVGDTVRTWPSISGGVQFPVSIGDQVYYAAFFAREQRLMRLELASDTSRSISFDDLDPGLWRDAAPVPSPSPAAARAYQPLEWLLWPQLWFPTLKLDTTAPGFDMVRGAGIATMSRDPAGLVDLQWAAAWLWHESFAEWSVQTSFHGSGIHLDLILADGLLVVPDASAARSERLLGVSAQVRGTLFESFDSLDWTLLAGYSGTSSGTPGTSPYQWDFQRHIVPMGASLGYCYRERFDSDGQFLAFGSRLSWEGYLDLLTPDYPPGIASAQLDLNLPFLSTHLGLAGAISTHPDISLGPNGPILASGQAWPLTAPLASTPVYAGRPAGTWQIQGQVDSTLRLDIEAPLFWDLWLNALLVEGGYRWLLTGTDQTSGPWLDSAFVAVSLEGRPGIVPILMRIPFRLGLRLDFALQAPESSAPPRLSLVLGM